MNMLRKKYVYFDNAATSLNKPYKVRFVVDFAMKNLTANPGRSGHILSQKVAKIINETRENLKDFFNAKSHEIVFTKNCTEALNLAIFGTLKKGDHVITTCYEHNSVLRPLERLKNDGVEVEILDCNLSDFHKEFEQKIKEKTKLVITTFVSNVTGEMCDVFSVAKICKKHGIKHLVDGAQACGHVEIDLKKIDCDMLAFAGHKGLLSLTGIGGLFVKNFENLRPIIYGGTGTESLNLIQPTDTVECFEAGTISSISIISLNSSVKYLKNNFSKILEKEQKNSEFLYKNLKKIKNLMIFSKRNSKNVFSFNIKDIDSGIVANRLNEDFGICVRAGFHCAPLVHKKFKTLDQGMVRVSLDFCNRKREIKYLLNAINKIANG